MKEDFFLKHLSFLSLYSVDSRLEESLVLVLVIAL